MAKWPASQGVTHVAMESAGVYPAPACHALMEHGGFGQVLACNAGHVKNVPGRKTGLADAEWLAQLLECGLLAGSFVPPADVKAVRDLVRYRAKIARQRVSEIARPGGVLQDAGIKTGSVASSIATKSGRAMIGALIDGERRGQVLADLGYYVTRPPQRPRERSAYLGAVKCSTVPGALCAEPGAWRRAWVASLRHGRCAGRGAGWLW
jgi:transposase